MSRPARAAAGAFWGWLRDAVPPALIAFLVLGAISTWSVYLIYNQDGRYRADSQRQDRAIAANLVEARYLQCLRANEFRDLVDGTFREVIAAAATQPTPEAKRELKQRLGTPLAKLKNSKRDCSKRRKL